MVSTFARNKVCLQYGHCAVTKFIVPRIIAGGRMAPTHLEEMWDRPDPDLSEVNRPRWDPTENGEIFVDGQPQLVRQGGRAGL